MKKRLVSIASIASIAVTIAVFAALFGLIAPVQGAWFTTYGQVFDTDGTTPVDGVSVTITNIETGSSIEPYVTALGGWYADNLANLKPNHTNKEGDRIQIFAYDPITGETNTTVVSRAALSPQEVNLILQAPTPPAWFTIYGQVFDTDGTTPVDGVSVTITNLETGSSIEPYVTALGGWYADNLANLKPNHSNKEGDRIQIVADDSITGKTNTTVVLRAAESPQEVNLTLQAPTPTPGRYGGGAGRVPPTPTPTLAPTPTPSETATLKCKTLWYFDDRSIKCQQDKFCGAYMYESLRTFETEEECKTAFEMYLKEKGKVTPTASPTPTPTPAPPGFEAGFAIAGLLAVAYLVLRRRN